ncbi:MAG: tRNA pseudouridine(55) synthase TruB [Firmicutes bacterium]|nr:tRNA pseudouridine(55) synthase TruB [Bacillota bacterium]
MSSHDVVALVRRLLGERHVGHAGTLDPPAAGVLLVLAGRQATRLAEYLLPLPKTYVAEVCFGIATDTQDWTGLVTHVAASHEMRTLDRHMVWETASRFVGRQSQVPPAVSALKVKGERLYRLAAEGRDVRPAARDIEVHALEILDFWPGSVDARPVVRGEPLPGPEAAGRPRARLRVRCSRGTYVRTLAHDIGAALGVGAHLSFLVREAVGPFRLAECATLEELAASGYGPMAWRRPAAEAVAHLPCVQVGGPALRRVLNGAAVPWPLASTGGLVRVLAPDGTLVAVGEVVEHRLEPRKVFITGTEVESP